MEHLKEKAPPAERSIGQRLTPRLAEEGWVAVPALLLRYMGRFPCPSGASGLSMAEVLVLIQLLSFKWTKEPPRPTIEMLMERLDLSRRRVFALLAGLKKKRLLNWERGARGRANRYDLQPLFRALEALADQEKERRLAGVFEAQRARKEANMTPPD